MQQPKKQFNHREWTENTPGDYDEDGFFITPNGSFWDPDYVYFNRDGYDTHDGYYDDNGVYVPGPNWDYNNQCYYEDLQDDFGDLQDDYYDQDDDDAYGCYADNDLIDEEKYLEITNDMEKIKITKEDYENMNQGMTFSNQPQGKEASDKIAPQKDDEKKEEFKKEPVPNKPKSNLALLFEQKERKEAEAKKLKDKKDQAKK